MNKTKSTRYILLIIGTLAFIAVGYGLIKGDSFTDHIMTLVCGSSLLFGSYTLGKEKAEASTD